ncbi:MAG: adenylate/guanylate cyclase domain-containing protein [Candidatus Peribacteraceae bacterium]|nr:adenylate/guanylate cyclase domain-containing protein [Candidatus Peribacteraceae bacterium]
MFKLSKETEFISNVSKKELSVLFCDIRNFTNLTEDLSIDNATYYVSMMYNHVADIVYANEGYIDKCVGDMIMVFWDFNGDLVKAKYMANKSCLEIKESMASLNKRLKKLKLPVMDVGIGISSGTMGIGMIGPRHAKNYTIIGNQVNLGARLESLTKQYKVKAIVDQNSLHKNVLYKELGVPVEKGRVVRQKIYEPICRKRDIVKRAIRATDAFFTSGVLRQAKKYLSYVL